MSDLVTSFVMVVGYTFNVLLDGKGNTFSMAMFTLSTAALCSLWLSLTVKYLVSTTWLLYHIILMIISLIEYNSTSKL